MQFHLHYVGTGGPESDLAVDQIEIPLTKRLIPLSFIQYVDVDTNAVEHGLKNIKRLSQERPSIIESQIVVLEEPVTKKLKEKLC